MYLKGKSTVSICKELHISRSRFSNFLKEEGIYVNPIPQKKKINERIFQNIDNEEKAYWLGFLYADGSISKGNRNDIELSLCLNDIHHLEKFKAFIGFGGKLIIDDFRCRISFKNKNMKKDLMNKGCVPQKSLTIKFPSYDIVPKELIRHFIRGYFDGDGSISCTDKTHSLCVLGTLDMMEHICYESGIPRKIYISKSPNISTYRILLDDKRDSLIFLHYLYDDCEIYLDRKYNKCKLLIDYFTAVRGRKSTKY